MCRLAGVDDVIEEQKTLYHRPFLLQDLMRTDLQADEHQLQFIQKAWPSK